MPTTISAPTDDAELVTAIGAGEGAAMRIAFERHHGAVLRAAEAILRDRGRAEDVAQDVFARLWSAPHRYRPDRGSLRTFLLMDARGRSIDLVRSARAAARRDALDHSQRAAAVTEDAADTALAAITSGVVRGALLSLPEEQRMPIGLAYLAGHSYRDVADLLAVPEGTVKSRIRAGFHRLRLDLEAG